jgi:hypothetical protein
MATPNPISYLIPAPPEADEAVPAPPTTIITKRPVGRPAGAVKPVNPSAKQNIMEVFEMLGGSKGFASWARANKTEFYRHYTKLIPVTLTGDEKAPIHIEMHAAGELRRLVRGEEDE